MNYSREDLKKHGLRALGSPVLRINVDDTQLEDRIDEAFDKFWEFHGDGSVQSYVVFTIEQKHIDSRSIEVDDGIMTISRILPYLNSPTSPNNLQIEMFFGDIIQNIADQKHGGLLGYYLTEQYLQTMRLFFDRQKGLRFNRHTNTLYIDTDWNTISVGDMLVIECWAKTDPREYIKVYNDAWLKKYVAALFKRQWGQNLIKYAGFQLPGGMVLDGRALYEDALRDIEALEQELIDTWQLPVDFCVG